VFVLFSSGATAAGAVKCVCGCHPDHQCPRGAPCALGTVETLPFRGRQCPCSCSWCPRVWLVRVSPRTYSRSLQSGADPCSVGSCLDRPPCLLLALQQAPLPSNPPLACAGGGCIPHSLFTIFTPLSPRTFADLSTFVNLGLELAFVVWRVGDSELCLARFPGSQAAAD